MLLVLLATLVIGAAPARAEDASVWDGIEEEAGVSLSQEELDAARELSDERLAELRALGEKFGVPPDLDLMVDPKSALERDPLHLDRVDPREFDIPVVVNDMVVKWMRYFTGSGRKWYSRWLSRQPRYSALMWERLGAAGLPKDLVYLSMVESGYSNVARSTVSAVGLWQFMAPTARQYGLRVDSWADERLDPELSTDAAIAFLGDLHDLYGDWYLAFAGYNAGPGRVNSSIRRNGTRDFWALSSLPEETRNYVPKIIAAAIIGKHPERYGFVRAAADPLPQGVWMEVDGSVSLEVVAKCAEVDPAIITELNPAYLKGFVPPGETVRVRVPTQQQYIFAANWKLLPPEEKLSIQRHVVAKGETLGVIAKKYGVSVDDIVAANRIKNPNVIAVGTELIIPAPGMSAAAVAEVKAPKPESAPAAKAEVAAKEDVKVEAKAKAPESRTEHTVRKGDTLSGIASRYGVTVDELKHWNDLDSNTIVVGQVLVVHGGKPAQTQKLTYTVQKGDTVSEIAARFGVSEKQLMEWNGLGSPKELQSGQTLKLYAPSEAWKTYTVQTGDNLGEIAEENGCTVADLKDWNDLDSTTIHPGQKLKIRADD